MIKHRLHKVSHWMITYMQVGLLAMPIVLGTVPRVSAAALTTRSIQISTAKPGADVDHAFSFFVPSSTNVAAIAFHYCSNSPLPEVICIPPVGLNLSSVTLTDQTTNVGFSINATESSAERIVISRVAAPMTVGNSTYNFENILNPTTVGQTVFVRIATYLADDATGPMIDEGSVAFAIADGLRVEAFVPPFLTFCVGVFVTLNCNSVTGYSIDIGELAPNTTATGTMQFSGATNDPSGYTTYLNGLTMTSGNNIIDALSSNSTSQRGVSQFGLNLRSNSAPSFGLDPVGLGSSAPTAAYNTPNSYRFVDGEAIASTGLPTDFKVFTASYIVNVNPDQPAGIYVATMTYTSIASF